MSWIWFLVLPVAAIVVIALLVVAARSCVVVTGGGSHPVVAILRATGLALVVWLVVTNPARAADMVGNIVHIWTSAVTSSEESASTSDAWACPDGDICFWPDKGGTGLPCNWDDFDPDWSSGTVKCSWTEHGARSLYNGTKTGSAVVYFAETEYQDPVGCARPGQRVDLPDATQVRSHTWVDDCP